MNIGINKKTVLVCIAAFGLSAALVANYFYKQKSVFLFGIFDSCSSDLQALIEIYENEDKLASLAKDSAEAKNLFLSIEEANCRDKKSTKKLYSELYQAIAKSSVKASSVNDSDSNSETKPSSQAIKLDQE
jgi:hypothetical protein